MLLNVRTSYTLLESTIKIDELVKKAKEYGYQAVGISDKNVLHGALELYQAAQNVGIKPLIGMEVELAGLILEGNYSFLVYAKDGQGYISLCQLTYALSDEDKTDKEIWELISDSPGLVYISLGRASELESSLIRDEQDSSGKIYDQLINVFGEGNIYLGQPADSSNPIELSLVRNFSRIHQVPIVINQLVRSINSADEQAVSVLKAISTNSQITSQDLQQRGVNYLYPKDQLIKKYQAIGLDQAVTNTKDLVDQLNVTIKTKQNLLPKFTPPEGQTSEAYLGDLCYQSLGELGLDHDQTYLDRLDYELGVIDQMGFNDYFLIVWQIIDYCHQAKIRTGPGRGSSAGSLVSFLLKITKVDPIEYDLLFERFLNPQRQGMPDIDIDIPNDKRSQVLSYIQKQYGDQRVAQIITFSTFGAKQSIRDSLRVLGYDNKVLNLWSNAVPSDPNQTMTLDRAYRESDDLKHLVNQSPKNQLIFQIAKKIEGLPRQTSEHAAGVVINQTPLNKILPVTRRPGQLQITQFAMDDVEEIGLLKMDFLGLRNLSLLDDILKNIEINQKINLNIDKIPMDDQATLELFQKGDTNGVFQFESDGIKNVLKKIKPTSFEDIVAVNALYRPGPMQQIDTFIKRKHKKEPITYVHPSLEPILKSTYGIIVYQEQVMQIVQTMAGYSLAEADILRRAIANKESSTMEKERDHFIQGCLAEGIDQDTAGQVFDYIEKFSNYGFNKAHAVVYSTLGFQLAYLKAHYPLEFYQGVLNSGQSQSTSFLTYFYEAKRRLKVIQTVDINHSQANFSIHNGKLIVGFNSVKALRKNFINHILKDRSQLGNYTGLEDFLRRLPENFLDKNQILALIKTGAFDSFGYNRRTLAISLDNLIGSVRFSGDNMNLFGEFEPKIDLVEEWDQNTLHQEETDLLGFSLRGHPLDKFDEVFDEDQSYTPVDQLSDLKLKTRIKTIGQVDNVKQILTRNNEQMAFVDLASQTGEISLVVFPKTYHKVHQYLKEKEIVQIQGRIDLDRRGQKQVIVDDLFFISLDQINIKQTNEILYQECWIRVGDFQADACKIDQAKAYTLENIGSIKLIFVDSNNQAYVLNHPYLIRYSPEIESYLVYLFGQGNVIFQ